jgi:hypothetical protein
LMRPQRGITDSRRGVKGGRGADDDARIFPQNFPAVLLVDRIDSTVCRGNAVETDERPAWTNFQL